MGLHDSKIRIFKLSYRKVRAGKRVRTVVVKVPYGGAFSMTELMTRMIYVGEVMWFRVEPATGKEIASVRDSMERWLPTLTRDREVDWTA